MNDKKKLPWIRPLPERLINKIAAGEVVERPSSVVKELVENSIDAGATRIDIVIEKSGIKLIKIVDNGCGIDESQIEIAFSRHATSKIAEFNDLDSITSYGFRGEALPSIASVSRTIMVSRPASADSGMEIVIEGGVLISKSAKAAPVGTTIEIENLFHNTPARRKFLKAETTEARHISRTVTALAIGRYDIGFSYLLNGRKVFSQPDGLDLGERVKGLLAPGRKFIAVTGEHGPVKIEGFIGTPDSVQGNRNGQYLFINGRFIHAPMLSHAFAAGYGEMLPRGNFPIGALLITVDPTEVDVNVHPSKTEVRLQRDREIHDSVYRLVKDALRNSGVIPTMSLAGNDHRYDSTSVNNSALPNSRHANDFIQGVGNRAPMNHDLLSEIYNRPQNSNFPNTTESNVNQSTGEIFQAQPTEPINSSDPTLPSSALFLIGRFDNLYLLFQAGSDLLVVDQHTAHERVLFEKTMREMDNQGGTAQHLLLAVQVDLSPEQVSLYEESAEMLNHSGFQIALFGGNTIRIEALPAILGGKSPEKAIRSILDDIAVLKKSGYDLKKAIAESIACRSAVMAGDRLNDKEATGLVEQLLKCDNMFSCPHGRPTFVKITRNDLDRQFGRA